MDEYKKIIYLIVALFIVLAYIFLTEIKATPKYDSELYNEIYNEYEDIFGEEESENEIIENSQNDNFVVNESSSSTNTTTTAEEATANVEQGYVIGKIVIPKIELRYPIIKETTTEYLKIAPTKYCGPELNEVRKCSYSWA